MNATPLPVKPPRKKIAVIGSGISGMSCAWLLNQSQDVTLYEKDDRLGGHSNTVTFELNQQPVSVDTGFIVYNPVNYPNLVAFFDALGVTTCETDMSFAVSINGGELEYSGSGLSGLLAQKSNLAKPQFWSMLKDLMRFYREADELLQAPENSHITLGQMLKQHNYGKAFTYNHLLPMGAAIWSVPVEKMLEYPATSFLRFCRNHGLNQLQNRPQWRTVVNGSRCYVDKIAQHLGNAVRLNTRIQSVTRYDDHVVVDDMLGNSETYDEVVFACHSDQALNLLSDASREEKSLLGCFPYQRNFAYLHQDTSLMPLRKKTWSSWNYLSSQRQDDTRVSVSYWMNRLQPLNTEQPLIVTLNPLHMPRQGTIIRSFFYDHPLFGQASLDAQRHLWSLQGKNRTWFCGAYFGYGFHEDGLQSGLAVAEALGGVMRPWQVDDPNGRIILPPDYVARRDSAETRHA
ncbi:FAD-dependent oxidoreductase [Porticoccus litoralis]|jgi:predicted NAD/FAD-binding protein|uniref:FAD-dependent oxidoreductase n=1 Tax=Porticoccus litoralis TaxID=434086 RepID=A0AAW8B2F0_9GAMM|nr:FAD-dependent oxidoreductase [Porticoccus litoralis]MDP1519725.1 FAD-dependent oxidoreductase [Porticoccus litoralis]